ncbi:MAG TPA: thioredoxin-like domain-containing protein [Tenuifilaceae bacterium]|nr:thioredoxin-like domain-containing protein [Tenuifilaceae bacterium]
MRTIFFLLITSLFMQFTACAQSRNSENKKGYRIEVNVDGVKDTTIMLGYHLGDKKYVADTTFVNSSGVGVFEGDSLLDGGMYLIILPERTYFDILVGDNQQFGVKTSFENLIDDLEFTNSPENTAFANYQRFMGEKQQRMAELRDQIQNTTEGDSLEKATMEEINLLDKQVKEYWDNLIVDNEGTFLATIIKSLKPVDIPEFEIPADVSNPDSLRWIMGYRYNQEHFFDNVDLTDDRLIRTPFFLGRLDTYFDRVLLPVPDTLTKYVARILDTTKENKRMFQYVVSHLLTKFQASQIMGMDAVFVYIAEKYYLSGDVDWISDEIKQKIQERVSDLKPNLIGQVAPNLNLKDFNNTAHELHAINAKVTIVYFWEPGCSHCKKVTPVLNDLYKKYKDSGFEVYAIYTQGEIDKWKEYINSKQLSWINVWDPTRVSNYHKLYDIYSTPIIYVLDKNKKIIAKRIPVESLEKFLEEELK